MNLLKLHEAIVVVLINKPNREATFDEIANEIASRNLYIKPKDGKFPVASQIMLRTTKSGGAYSHLFESTDSGKIKLRNS